MPGRHSFTSKLIAYIGIILIFLAFFLAVYAPVIQKDFYYKEDYTLLKEVKEASDPATVKDMAIKEGRIANGFMLFYLWTHARDSKSMKAMRLVGIIGMSLFASVIWAILKKFRFRADHSFLMSLLICTLPCPQIYILSIMCINFTYGALLSSLSALIVFHVICKEGNKGGTYEIIGALTAIFLLVTSLTIYQSAAMMYWATGIIFVLAGDNYDYLKKYHRPLIKYFFIGFISIIIYYLVFLKIVPFIMNFPSDRASLITINKIPVKLIKFLIIPFKNAINLWNIYPSYKFAFFVSMIIFSEIIIGLLQAIKEKKQFLASTYYQKYFLILCLLILSYLPNLIVAENAYTYRTLISIGSSLSLLFCFGLVNIVEFFKFTPKFSAQSRNTAITVLLTLLVIVTAFMARYNATHWQSPNQLDIYIWEKWRIG